MDVKRDYIRDGEGQFAHVPGAGLVHAVTAAADKLGLAERIQLGDGEQLVSSTRLPGAPGGTAIAVVAAVQVGEVRQVRLGIVDPEDARRWRAGNRGGTVVLDEAAARQLDTALTSGAASGTHWSRIFQQTWAEVDILHDAVAGADDSAERDRFAEMLDAARHRADAIAPDAVIASGTVQATAWGDLAYEVAGTDDGDGGWSLRLAVRPHDAPDDWTVQGADYYAEFLPEHLRTLRRQVAAAATPKTPKTAEGSGMQHKSFRAEVKDGDEPGTIRFVVATLNEVDKDGDVTLPGFFGTQSAVMVPVHDWDHVPIGKGTVTEVGNEAIAEVKLNLAIPAAKDWYEAIKFDMANPPALQEYSYGFSILDGGAEYGQHKGRSVRFLKSRPDGSPGADVHEMSPVLLGAGNNTRTLGVKSAINIRFADEAQAVVAAVRALSDRAADVLAKRQEKGKGLGVDSADLLRRVEAELKRLHGLLGETPTAVPEPDDTDELRRIALRQLVRNHP